MFHRHTLPVTAFSQNCSLVWCDETNEAALIDPGGDIPLLLGAIEERGLTLKALWLTHAHIDHAGASGTLARTHGVPIIGPHPGDQFWIDALPQQSQMFGFPQAEPFAPTQWLKDGDTVTIGKHTLQVLHCPGHTPGHVVLFEPATRHAFVGDVLFAGSIGRTDFPGGNHADLINAIKGKLLPLGDDITFTPGHGPESTFGEERLYNPYLAAGR
ncbi:MBL fold metallo-hydrolase [Aquabacterium soli]|uniref:MBL fold metallo-hydrolase n=1 Tax=Aquabacterium soli TaxID=2493092 RepID=A0A3R8YKB1_9BURK|nr:MBL fold metallo-hydrolase [Aquabacterium soli]RRS02425.1 MBL fold metallo-hydrolase [Aquabacterium soli]